MGKASKWFRGLLGLQKTQSPSSSSSSSPKNKRRWSFLKPHTSQNHNDLHHDHVGPTSPLDPDMHAAAVAAATAAVAEAAVAAAEAAAAVVRLTSSGRCGAAAGSIGIHEEWAAVKIQSAFRGSLARKALRALKGLVKLQALVRGHIERKRTAEWLKRMQALLRTQARVCAGRAQIIQTLNSTAKSSIWLLHGPATPDKFESPIRSKSMKYEQSPVLKRHASKSCGSISANQVDEQSWNQGRSCMTTCSKNAEKSDRILEIDFGNPQVASKRRNLFFSTKDSTSLQSGQTPSCEVQSFGPLKVKEVEETPFCTASNSPQFLSASSKDDGSKRSPFTPTRSDGSRSYLYGYSDYPSYMAYTESSKAKGPATPDKFESPIRSKSMKYEQSPVLKRHASKSCGSISANQVDEQSWNQGRSCMTTCSKNAEKSDRILEIDFGNPQVASKRRNLFFSTKDSTSLQSGQTPSCEVQSFGPLKVKEVEETPFCTASNSPQFLSASSKDDGSKRSPFTPTRSDGSRSYLYGYSDYPSYMAYTESSKAKVRSLSAPKQRPQQYDRSTSSNRFGDPRLATHRAAALHTGFTSKAYPGSGRLDKLGMPVGYRY